MPEMKALDDMVEDEILDFAGACADTVRRAEVDLLRAAYQWAIVHPAVRLDPAEAAKPGREKARMLGGDGTPEVSEFAAAEFGARIGRSPYAAARLIGDALDLRHRHPQLWARVEAGEVRASYARHVTAKTRDLTAEQAAYVDAAVVESADGRIPWSRFETLVDAKVAQAAPELAREKEERAAQARFARKLRGEAHGMASFLVRADVATINAIEAAVSGFAARLVEPFPDATDDERRVLAVLLMACGRAQVREHTPDTASDETPDVSPAETADATEGATADDSLDDSLDDAPDNARDDADASDSSPDRQPELSDKLPDLSELLPGLLPEVVLYVHTYAGPDREPIARVEGHGPVTDAWVRDTLGPNVRFRIQPVIDLAGQAPVDAYEIPDRHRQAVHLTTPADTFPFASCTDRAMQVDHTVPHAEGGVSGVGNYGPMTTTHHRIKTHCEYRGERLLRGAHRSGAVQSGTGIRG